MYNIYIYVFIYIYIYIYICIYNCSCGEGGYIEAATAASNQAPTAGPLCPAGPEGTLAFFKIYDSMGLSIIISVSSYQFVKTLTSRHGRVEV